MGYQRKYYGIPIYEFLGGKARDRIKVYSWIGGDRPDDVAKAALERKKMGFDAVKMNATEELHYVDTFDKVQAVVDRVASIREVLGNDFGIAVDFHGRVHKPMAKVLAHELEPYKLMFFEEVVLPENEESFQSIANQVSTPLATGERLITRWEYKRLFQQGAVDIIQPDVALCGGILETKKSYQWQRRMIWQQHHMHHMVQSHLLRRYKWMFALQMYLFRSRVLEFIIIKDLIC